MNILGIDPGRDKCGVAVLTDGGEIIFQSVIATADLEPTLKNLVAQNELELAILGDGTTHKAAEKILRTVGLSVKIVDEKHTTEEARHLYWEKNPPRGWRKLLPTSMQVPPEPVDALVAEILVRRFLSAS
ncbi:MAG: RuvX/YqgF family protein [Selenomonadaceae bacterium]|nr:RuvX/YqgF family protein [Selenomonadaceae bacterium]